MKKIQKPVLDTDDLIENFILIIKAKFSEHDIDLNYDLYLDEEIVDEILTESIEEILINYGLI